MFAAPVWVIHETITDIRRTYDDNHSDRVEFCIFLTVILLIFCWFVIPLSLWGNYRDYKDLRGSNLL